MKTISFIGSHKNAGKTTVLNYVHHQLYVNATPNTPICLTSIGINGEDADAFDGKPKPLIPVYKGSLFITSAEHLKDKAGRYQVLYIFSDITFKKIYVLGKALTGFTAVIEGPNGKQEILAIKENLRTRVNPGILLIDGSVDRQFLAHPDISDAIYVSMFIPSNKKRQTQMRHLVSALSIPEVDSIQKQFILKNIKAEKKTFLFDDDNTIIYMGREIPFLDEELRNACLESKDTRHYLYVNGALSASFYEFLSPLHNLIIVLDNFTCVQNIGKSRLPWHKFRPELRLLHPPIVRKVFLKQENKTDEVALPEDISVYNLFRDNINEIGI